MSALGRASGPVYVCELCFTRRLRMRPIGMICRYGSGILNCNLVFVLALLPAPTPSRSVDIVIE